MADTSLTRENFVLHKLHSLSGIIPVGFYMVQHLTLNSFSWAGPEAFDGVIGFFDSIPKYLLLILEICAIWVPLAFHAIYGVVIVCRAQSNFIGTKYGWSQNRMFFLQRASGLILVVFLIWHVLTTTGIKYFNGGDSTQLKYAAWHAHLTANHGALLIFYLVGILSATYHLAYGIWNFCIRWGITVSPESQVRVQKLSFAIFIALTVLGWGALLGFVIPNHSTVQVRLSSPAHTASYL